MAAENVRAIIIDDEKDAIDLLLELLKDHPGTEVVATADNAEEAYRLILAHKPDLVFLDIQMPRETGLELAKRLSDLPERPAVIFVTAYDQFAISAIKNAALDYILKPVNRKELDEAIARFRKRKHQTDINKKLDDLVRQTLGYRKVKFNTRTGALILDPDEIVFCKAGGNYSEIFTASGKKELVSLNLGQVEKILPETVFVRISRFYIVNINFVSRIDRKNQNCEIGINGATYNLTLPKKNLNLLDRFLSEKK